MFLSIHQVINFLPWGIFKCGHDYQIIRKKDTNVALVRSRAVQPELG